jgi:hypothetical protein
MPPYGWLLCTPYLGSNYGIHMLLRLCTKQTSNSPKNRLFLLDLKYFKTEQRSWRNSLQTYIHTKTCAYLLKFYCAGNIVRNEFALEIMEFILG